ncbi:OsmC family protein [Virgibacillus kimchii]
MKFTLKENGVRTELEYGQLDISGNEEFGYRPYQLMVASIVGCSSSVFLKVMEKQRTEIDDLQVEAKVERNPDEANRIEKIHLHFLIKGKQLDQDKLYKNLEVSRRNCSMVRSVENSIEIEESIEILPLSM